MYNGDDRKINKNECYKNVDGYNALVKRFIGSKSAWKAIQKNECYTTEGNRKSATKGAVRCAAAICKSTGRSPEWRWLYFPT